MGQGEVGSLPALTREIGSVPTNEDKENKMTFSNYPNGLTSFGLPVLPSMDVGNVYWVNNSPTSGKGLNMTRRYGDARYDDGTLVLGTDIQLAIDKCVGGRNDYVMVGTGAYTLTALLNMAGKSSVHLIGQNGLGCSVGSVGAAALTQTGNYAVVNLDSYQELAGFQIVNLAAYGAVTWNSASSWRTNIHHNYFHVVNPGSSTTVVGSATGNANSHGLIAKNVFRTYVGGALEAVIGFGSGGAVDVIDNIIIHATGGAANYGIYNDTVLGCTMGNIVSNGGTGTINTGIRSHATSCTANNRVMGCTAAISGGTDEKSYSQNFSAASGGATALEEV